MELRNNKPIVNSAFFGRKKPAWGAMPLMFLNLFQDEENEWMSFYKYKYVLKLLEPVPKE